MPLSEKPAGNAANRREPDADSLEERWARLGVHSRTTDRTEVLPGTAPRTRPAGRPGDDSRAAATSDGPERSEARPDGPWDAERTTALRIPRPESGAASGPESGAVPRPESGAAPRPESGAVPRRPETGGRPVGDARAAVTPDGPERSEARPDGPWDAERTTALRIPRPQTGTPAARATRPPGNPARAGSPQDTARFPGPAAAGSPQDTARFPGPAAAGSPHETDRFPGPGPAAPRTPARDPWQEPGEPVGATHDPHEVTVQLDAVQIGDGGVLRRSPGGPGPAQDAPAGPVFVDESGRRSRLYRRIGMAVGLACAGYAVVMVATLLSGNSDAPWMPVPGQEQNPAGKVETTPQPAETDAVPSTGGSLPPDGTPTTGAPALPTPGATLPATDEAGTANQPDAADPAPTSAGQDTTRPATGGDDATPTTPDETPVTTPPDAPASESPAPGTTAPTGDGSAAGTDDVAGAPAGPRVAADGSAGQQEPSTAPTAPSSENVI
ncbi:hypothetical protein ACFV2D_32655 [Streptomyces capillispiralis]|uniref:hypothetical protein n=1 Tax=Streptomyces capillispiralis TaxID=68182 RepID=UPI0036987F21